MNRRLSNGVISPAPPRLGALLLATLWTLGGCGAGTGDADDGQADTAAQSDVGQPASTLALAPAVCGAPGYAWLPTAATPDSPGHLRAHKKATKVPSAASKLATLLGAVGVKLPLEYRYDVQVHQIRYTTQDRGVLTEATGFVALPVPTADQPALEVDLLLYLHGTAGFSDGCAPSAKTLDPIAGAALASFGHVVVAPDYLGMNGMGAPSTQLHPYVIAEPTALASLDAVRAARELLGLGLVPGVLARPGVLVLGGSQGGHAAIAVGRYGGHYAPDEPVIAVAASVPLIDVVGEAVLATQSKALSTENLAAILTAMAQWYGLDIASALRPPFDLQAANHVQTACALGGILKGASTPADLFTTAFLEAAQAGFAGDDAWSCALRHNSLVHDAVAAHGEVPTLVVFAEDDELLSAPVQHAAYDALCAAGLPVRFLECAGLGHTGGALASLPEQLDFLHARREGLALPGKCARGPATQCAGEVKLP